MLRSTLCLCVVSVSAVTQTALSPYNEWLYLQPGLHYAPTTYVAGEVRMRKGDVNQDGKEDFLALGDSLHVYMSALQPPFVRLVVSNTVLAPYDWADFIDINGDGDLDIVAYREGSGFHTWHYHGQVFTSGQVFPFDAATDVVNGAIACVGDVDGDGDMDVLFEDDAAGGAFSYLDNAPGNWGVHTVTGLSSDALTSWVLMDGPKVVFNGAPDRVYHASDVNAAQLTLVLDWSSYSGSNNIAVTRRLPEYQGGQLLFGDCSLNAALVTTSLTGPMNQVVGVQNVLDLHGNPMAGRAFFADLDNDSTLDVVAAGAGCSLGAAQSSVAVSNPFSTSLFDLGDGLVIDADGDGDQDLLMGSDSYGMFGFLRNLSVSASTTAFGMSCGPMQEAVLGAVLGQALVGRVTNLAGPLSVVVFGETGYVNPISLPGMPGCFAHISSELVVVATPSANPGEAWFSLPIPNQIQLTLAGVTIHSQVVDFDPNANALGLSTSHAITWKIEN